MEKKYFIAPSLKVVKIKEDIITTSNVGATIGGEVTDESGILAPGRNIWGENEGTHRLY